MPLGTNDIKLPLNTKQFVLDRELDESGEEKRILMNLHVKRMIDDHLKPSLKGFADLKSTFYFNRVATKIKINGG